MYKNEEVPFSSKVSVWVFGFNDTKNVTLGLSAVNRTSVADAFCTFCRFSESVGYASPYSLLIPSKLWEQF